MRVPLRAVVIGLACLAVAAALGAQQPAAPRRRGAAPAGAAAGRGRAPSYPTRPQYDPAAVARGAKIFSANCSFCHGDDARGGSVGPNLVRAQVVLDDQHGELITPILHGALVAGGMPKFDLSSSDIGDVADWLHSLSLDHNAPPENLDILVGNAAAGKAYFNGAGQCSSCHSVTGDLAGIGGKYQPKELQNLIVSGGAGGRGFGLGAAPVQVPPTTVTVTLANGQTVTGKLDHQDAFFVSLTEANGTYRSFTIAGDTPQVVVHHPLEAHVQMLRTWNDTDIHNLTAYLATLQSSGQPATAAQN
ncbi:MAG TPA: c-type cytochrome [Terriglobales bacterium]|jgi:mono/diheme cytochrome c family protein